MARFIIAAGLLLPPALAPTREFGLNTSAPAFLFFLFTAPLADDAPDGFIVPSSFIEFKSTD